MGWANVVSSRCTWPVWDLSRCPWCRPRPPSPDAGLAGKPADALLMTAADKTQNGLCIAADVRRYGAEFWEAFNASPDELAWYYTRASGTWSRRGCPALRSPKPWTAQSPTLCSWPLQALKNHPAVDALRL